MDYCNPEDIPAHFSYVARMLYLHDDEIADRLNNYLKRHYNRRVLQVSKKPFGALAIMFGAPPAPNIIAGAPNIITGAPNGFFVGTY